MAASVEVRVFPAHITVATAGAVVAIPRDAGEVENLKAMVAAAIGPVIREATREAVAELKGGASHGA